MPPNVAPEGVASRPVRVGGERHDTKWLFIHICFSPPQLMSTWSSIAGHIARSSVAFLLLHSIATQRSYSRRWEIRDAPLVIIELSEPKSNAAKRSARGCCLTACAGGR